MKPQLQWRAVFLNWIIPVAWFAITLFCMGLCVFGLVTGKWSVLGCSVCLVAHFLLACHWLNVVLHQCGVSSEARSSWLIGRITVQTIWYDLRVGFFWDRKRKLLYFFPLPCLGFKINCLSDRERDDRVVRMFGRILAEGERASKLSDAELIAALQGIGCFTIDSREDALLCETIERLKKLTHQPAEPEEQAQNPAHN